jgi:O-antigen ligase
MVTLSRAWRQKTLFRGERLVTALVLGFMALAFVQVWNPNVPSIPTGLEGFRKTAFTMVGFLAVRFADGSAARFYRICGIGAIVAILWGIRQFFFPLGVEVDIVRTAGASFISFHSGPVLRAFAPTSGPFHFGILCASVSVIGLALLPYGRAWFAVSLAAAAGLGLSLTRANMVAAAVSLLVVAVMRPAGLRFSAGLAALGIILVVGTASLTAVGLFGTPPQSAVRQALATPSPSVPLATATATPPLLEELVEGLSDPMEDRSLQFRFQFWASHLKAILHSPIVGYGTSSAGDGFGERYEGTDSVHFDPHSLYLKPALELGVVGALLFVAILGCGLMRALQLRPGHSVVSTISVGLTVLVAISGLTGPMLDAYPFNLLYWAALGWVVRGSAGASLQAETSRHVS